MAEEGPDLVAFAAELEAAIDRYCAAACIGRATLSRRALGNHMFAERLAGRLRRLDRQITALRDHMAANPPKPHRNWRPRE